MTSRIDKEKCLENDDIESDNTQFDIIAENIVCRNFYDAWESLFPQLSILLDNIDTLKEEINNIKLWVPWPEDHFTLNSNNSKDWTVFPFLHTFPAYGTNSIWIQSTSSICPKTVSLLKQVPNIKTALFSKLGPLTQLSSHTGWADLSNYVLRCHLTLKSSQYGNCGLVVCGETRYHNIDDFIVFDDSKKHYAFNASESEERIVLIVDILRPTDIPIGMAVGLHTEELDHFVAKFK